MKRLLALTLAAALLSAACGGQRSDEPEAYPSDQIRLIVPYTAGGPTDIAARSLGKYMETSLGQTVVVENLPGASGSTAYQELLSAEPDGYTLSMSALPTAVLNYLTNDVGYTRDSFAPVGVITQVPSALVVPAASPYADLAALFAAARSDPTLVSVGTPGATNTHAAETRRITQIHGVPLTVVPFNGAQEVLAALLGGNVVAGFVNASQDMLPAIESGQLRVLAVGTEERLPYIDAPTFAEQGYPEITQSTTTFGVVAPAGTPQPVIARLEETMRAASADPETRRGLDERYVPEQFMGSADLAALFTETEQTFQGVASGG
ncbi:tripartite-type tricarboxylate transporter receptor subunit TctC [Pseudonocardia hierapolitana]|uniref:Tripartite-type tricarboxylate transporter receptor subunit TctC n=1 Tax=Pseudonocardia hierapolitana TaxID=1128676 RepID=A0A561SQL3_9PSEU|nr:tripartite tricarboxylate transporter substrate binding protein [Pseudonocardia hierapolitana]TWF77163.1 tripartite-type tricarboxylate transporter receptor subunit TctC [Pseudonocardia hierapolitana]